MTTLNGHVKEATVATRTMSITDVKANLLALVTEVGDTGDEIVITRRGRPVARLVRAASEHPLKGSLVLPDDMAAYDLSAEWAGSDLA
ncbi:MAG: type II toxin-antitoxin system Phd/YefM family antitoxin [Actinomycetota bacterium]